MAVAKGAVRIGWGWRDITPRKRCELDGQYYRRIAIGVRDPLHVTAWVVEGGGPAGQREHVVMVALDLAMVTTDLLEAVRQRVHAPGLDPRRIILNAVHTHNAPATSAGIFPWLKPTDGLLGGEEYAEQVAAAAAEAVAEAWQGRKPGSVGWSLSQARVGHCRRACYADGTAEMYGRTDRPDFIGLEAGEDSGVDLLFCWDARQRLTGVVANLACPSQVMEATYQVTADFLGEARRQVRRRFGRDVFFLGQVSAAGDQSPRDLVRGYRGDEPDMWHESGLVELGRRVAAAVAEGHEQARADRHSRLELKHVVRNIQLPVWRATPQQYRQAKATLKRLEARQPRRADAPRSAFNRFLAEMKANEAKDGPGPYDSKLHEFVIMEICRAVLERHRTQAAAPSAEMELHAVRLGEVAFATNPFELFLDYGSRIKARSPARQTFLVQLACGALGYLPTARAIAHGGYGATMTSAIIGSEGGDKLVEESLRSLAALWKA